MKKFVALMAIIAVGYTGLSQTLTPRVLIEGGDTLFAFTLPQSKVLYKYIVAKQYGDSIQDVNSQVIAAQDSIIALQKRQGVVLRSVIENDNAQIKNLNILNATLRSNLGEAQDKISKMKKRRWLYFGAGVLTSAITVSLLNK